MRAFERQNLEEKQNKLLILMLDGTIDISKNFEIVDYDYTYNIAQENSIVKSFAGDTVFGVIKKK